MATLVFEVREKAAKAGEHAWVKSGGIRTFEDLQNLNTDYSGNWPQATPYFESRTAAATVPAGLYIPCGSGCRTTTCRVMKAVSFKPTSPRRVGAHLDRHSRSVQSYMGHIATLLQVIDVRQEPQSYENILGRIGAMISVRLSETISWAEVSKHRKQIELIK